VGLQQFERRLERLVEGVFTRALRSGLQPVEVARKLIREIDDRRTVGVNGVIAPNAFTVAVSPGDRERFASFEDALVNELNEAARDHAREEGYHFVGPMAVAFETDERLRLGECTVFAEIVAGPGGREGSVVLGDGRRITVGENPVTIGRMPDCDIALADPEVSRRHAEVVRTPEGFAVHDLGSTNGTKVNGAPVKDQPLSDGDEIRVGTTTFRFEAQ
jgi:hypothetical protein